MTTPLQSDQEQSGPQDTIDDPELETPPEGEGEDEVPPEGEETDNGPSELELYQQALAERAREQERTNNELAQMRAQLEQLTTRANQPPPEEEDELPDFATPKEQMAWLAKQIKKEVAQSTEGVNRVAADYGRQQQVAEAKRVVAAHPEFGPIAAEMGEEADRIIEGFPDLSNAVGLATVLYARYGQMARSGLLKKSDTTTTTTKAPTVQNPTIRNSPPPKPPTTKAPKLVITEAERVMAKRRGMSPEEWCEIRDAGSEVSIDDLNAIHKKYAAKKDGK